MAGRTEVGGTNAAVPGLSVSETSLGTKELDLSNWGNLPMAAGRPSEIRIEGVVPPEGAEDHATL